MGTMLDQGSRYEGGFRRGKEHGHGVYVGEDGEMYDGEWSARTPPQPSLSARRDGTVTEFAVLG